MLKNEGSRKSYRYWLFGVVALLLVVALSQSIAAAGSPTGGTYVALDAPKLQGKTIMSNAPLAPAFVQQELKHDTSPRLDSMPEAAPQRKMTEREQGRRAPTKPGVPDFDTVVQETFGPFVMPTPIISMDGVAYANSSCNCAPPDTNGDVGPNHYVQTVNSAYQVFNKSGVALGPARALNTLWAGFGGVCQIRNDGDPIVKYDQMADRWLINQFTTAPPFTQCIAVSTTGDPNGSYHRYAFAQFESLTRFGDYQKIGVWPDAYYMSNNEFNATATEYLGAGNYAFDRTSMLQGLPASYVYFGLPATDWGGQQPSDLDGANLPPAGAPNLFVEIDDSAWDPPNIPTDMIQMWRFHADFAVPANSSFTALPAITPPTLAAFDGLLCNFGNCVPQQGTTARLAAIADRVMYRVAYRNFGPHQSIVFNHTVDTGTDKAAIRWYELRDIHASPSIFQQGTYDPDANHRWMGSIAQDNQGNMALGYSVSSSTMFPAIRYSGRLVADPPGQLPQGEATLHNGTGSQTGTNGRWGDYSSISTDPVDDCTFWYTQEYYATTSSFNWRTRFGSFKYEGCTAPVQGTPTATSVASATSTATSILPTLTLVVSTPTRTVTPLITSTSPPPPPTTSIPTATATSTSTLAATATSTVCTIQFSDVPSTHTFYDSVRCLACRGIVSGYSDGTFRPNNQVTRGQLAKMVSNSAGFSDPVSGQTFEDVPPSNTFYEWIERLTTRGYMTGYNCGGVGEPCTTGRPYFRPFANATRGQTSKIVSNAAMFTEPPVGQTFEDVPPSHTFYAEIQRLASRNVMQGYACGGPFEPCVGPGNRPYFRPGNDVTRGQSAKIVANTFFSGCITP